MKKLVLSLLVMTCLSANAGINQFEKFDKKFNKINYEASLDLLLKNIHPEGTVPGVVVASPSKAEPDYFYHWVRDAGLVMSAIFDVMEREQNDVRKAKLEGLMYDFAQRVKENQQASGFWSLGEPKYHVDGAPFTGPWGRPQHDGPALRAITLIKFANYLIDQGLDEWVIDNLYTPILPAISPIKMDLEYVALHYDAQGFDYWEEVKGLHFSTAMGQRRALLSGAKLARRLNDPHAAEYYEAKAREVEKLVNKFWNPKKGYIESTLDQTRGVWKSQLDISVILGVHHGDNSDSFFSPSDWRVMKTAARIEESFNQIYSINSVNNDELGTAIGRYPEDSYDGYRTDRLGNPWFLTTFAMAEYYLRLSKEVESGRAGLHIGYYCKMLNLKECRSLKGSSNSVLAPQFVKILRNKAEAFFKRADYHAADFGHMDEQMNRNNGYMMGARDLTWSYAAHIQALMQL